MIIYMSRGPFQKQIVPVLAHAYQHCPSCRYNPLVAAWDVLLQRSKVAVRSQQQGHGELKLQVHLGGYDEYSSHSVTAREGDGALELSLTARMLSVLRTTEEVWSASLAPLKAGGPVLRP